MRHFASVVALVLAVFFISVTPKSGKGTVSGFGPIRAVISIHHTPAASDRRLAWGVFCDGILESDGEHGLEGTLEPPIYSFPFTFSGCASPYTVMATIVAADGKQKTVTTNVTVLSKVD
jgi:hypothetical protein